MEQVYSYDDYEKALFSVDAVYIVLPNHLHREYAVLAAQDRVHVLCEKLMAVTEEDCEVMIDAARQNGVKLMVCLSPALRERQPRSRARGEKRQTGKTSNLRFGICSVGRQR